MEQLVGRTLGPYRLEAILGSGGMGVVYRAVHQGLRQHRAVKVLSPALAADPVLVERFQREAMIAAGLRHPNIVLIYDVAAQDGLDYIVMDLVDGESLRDLLRASGPMPLTRVIPLLRQLADALDYAHGRGVFHRDVKPANLLMGPSDHLTLLDFGIARAAEGSRLTGTGTTVGTPNYLAPEALTGSSPGASADLYALGVIAFELLTGQVPFHASSIPDLMQAQRYDPPPSPRSLRPELPDWVERPLLRQLAKLPAERYPDGSTFVAALASPEQPVSSSLADAAQPPTHRDAPTVILDRAAFDPDPDPDRTDIHPSHTDIHPAWTAVDPDRTDVHPDLTTPINRKPRSVVLIGLAVVVLVGLLGALFLLTQRPSGPAETSAKPTGVPLATVGPSATVAPAQPKTAAPPGAPAVASSPVVAGIPLAAPAAAAPRVPPSPSAAARPVFEAQFGQNSQGWVDNPLQTAWLEGGVYRLFGRQPGRFVAVRAPMATPLRDVIVRGAFRKLGGPQGGGTGIIIRDQSPAARDGQSQGGRYYVFESGDRGEWGIWRREEDHWVDLFPWTPSPAVRPDRTVNELLVQAIGPRLTFLINGVQVASLEDNTLQQGGVGVYLGGDLNEIAVERFAVQAP